VRDNWACDGDSGPKAIDIAPGKLPGAVLVRPVAAEEHLDRLRPMTTSPNIRLLGDAVWLVLLIIFAVAPLTMGQTAGTGGLAGIVLDPSGATVNNATVTITNSDTGLMRTATTRTDGRYAVALLSPGTYSVKFAATGFMTAEIPSVKINVTETQILDWKLEVGLQTEQVTVTATVDPTRSSAATLGTIVAPSTVSGLPLNTRNYTNILALSAGANASVNNASQFGKGSLQIAVNGANSQQNNFLMDGVSVINAVNGGVLETSSYAGIPVPSPDAISEFKIQTSLYDAGSGRNAGANVDVVIKSGTNALHGTAFEFFRNTDLDANDFFLNRAGFARPVLNQNQFGGVLGGPIRKDRLFFFFSYQGTKQRNGAASQGFAPNVILPPVPQGDRSNTILFREQLGAQFCPTNHPGDSRFATFEGGVQVLCDGSNINPVAINILQLKNPDGSYLIPGSANGTFQSTPITIPAKYTEHQYTASMDYLIDAKETLSARYFFATDPQHTEFLTSGCGGGNCLPGAGAIQQFDTTSAIIKLTSLLSNSMVNEGRVSLLRNVTKLDPGYSLTDPSVGITPIVPSYPALSSLSFAGLFQAGGSTFDNSHLWDTQIQFGDQFSWTRGRHAIRAGFEFEDVRFPWNYSSLSKGTLILETFDDFLLGLPGCAPGNSSCSAANPGNTNGSAFSNIFATSGSRNPSIGLIHNYLIDNAYAFVQDDIKIGSRLTVNAGLRWEYFGILRDKYGNNTNIWPSQILTDPIPGGAPATGTLAGFVVPANYPAHFGNPPAGVLVNGNNGYTRSGTPLDNFAPRLGFAWRPWDTNKFVVRGGGGFFYDRVVGDSQLKVGVQAIPYSNFVSASGTANYFSTLGVPFNSTPLGWVPRWVNLSTGASSNITENAGGEIYKTPLTYQWDLGMQYEFAPKWIFELDYVGSHGIHQMVGPYNINGAQLASPSDPLYGAITSNTLANVNVRVPYLGFSPAGVSNYTTIGVYKFNSLQATLRKQLSRGLTLQAAYTFSRAFTNATVSNNSTDFRQDYGLNTGYRPERLVVSFLWDLPWGRRRGVIGKILSGWSLSGLGTIQGGLPMTILDQKGGSIFGLAGQSRAQLCPGVTNSGLTTSGGIGTRLNDYFTSSAFCPVPAIGNGTGWGNSGVGILLGPGQANWDVALIKTTVVGGFTDTAAVQLRAEFFNAFNHPQFNNPGTALNTASFGLITSTSVNPRLIQFALKYVF
jgi:hypothetical protein